MADKLKCPCCEAPLEMAEYEVLQPDRLKVFFLACDGAEVEQCTFRAPMRESEEEAREVARIVCFLYEIPATRGEPGVKEGENHGG